ncbi:MAG: cyclase family protein [Chloroflexi bacterium]|nr:cyclase family protein [Chloroflexota bacterium]
MIYDISLPISESLPVYPGDPSVTVDVISDVSSGAPYTLTRISMGSHTGTHVDAPLHLLANGDTVDNLPIDLLMGPCYLASADIDMPISIQELDSLAVPPETTRLLLRTRNAKGYLTQDAASRLVETGVKLVGIDSPSVDAPGSPDLPAHRVMLEAEVIIVENLALDAVNPGGYLLVCLPLRIAGCDGAPARAVLMDSIADLMDQASHG